MAVIFYRSIADDTARRLQEAIEAGVSDGKSEIFVTNYLSNTKKLSSFTLEWDGVKFQKIADKENWLYRAIDLPGRAGRLLMGQKQGNRAADPFTGGVYELKWNDGRYVPAEQQALPKTFIPIESGVVEI